MTEPALAEGNRLCEVTGMVKRSQVNRRQVRRAFRMLHRGTERWLGLVVGALEKVDVAKCRVQLGRVVASIHQTAQDLLRVIQSARSDLKLAFLIEYLGAARYKNQHPIQQLEALHYLLAVHGGVDSPAQKSQIRRVEAQVFRQLLQRGLALFNL